MPIPSSGGFDFPSALANAQSTPQADTGRDLPDGFPLRAAPNHRIVDSAKEPEKISGAVEYDFTVERDVFVIYRPWEHCNRCADALANQAVELPPDEGDYVCPHTRSKQYKAVVDQILAGKLLFGSETETVQRDGTIIVSLRWYVPKPNSRLTKQRNRERTGDLP